LGQLSIRLKDADVIVLIHDRSVITKQLIEKLPKLKLIAQTGFDVTHIDVQSCTEHGIAVAQGNFSPYAPAELTWALVLAAARRLPHYIGNLKHGAWQQSGLKASSMPANFGLGVVLRGKSMGIWGFGKVGEIVAGYAKAFGMNVIVWGSNTALTRAQNAGYAVATSKEELFRDSDVLSIHLKLSATTKAVVTATELALMKPSAIFINTARAELVEPDALLTALNRGRPGIAAIDVFENEPILQGHALLRLENCVCTPHIGYVERESYEMHFDSAFDNVISFIKGTPKNIVNPGALQVRR
jgi:D-3-phosphoglycerate dehydrogenase